jgi:queuine tRNA-ribosyltransferase catalytic subunit
MCLKDGRRSCLFFLTAQDSGGFQFVSLSKFATITEEGALFQSPFNGEMTMLTVMYLFQSAARYLFIFFLQPEESISIQHVIGADIIMQLDDVGVLSFMRTICCQLR